MPAAGVKSQPDDKPGVVNSDFARQQLLKKEKTEDTPGAVLKHLPPTQRDAMSKVNQTNLHPNGVS